MSLPIYDELKAMGEFPLVNAKDVRMPDGSRLSAFNPVMPVLPGTAVLEPEVWYQFGEVSELAVELAQKDDGKAHEYVLDFVVPAEGFAGLTITPAPTWLREPQYPAGKRCVVSIMQGLAVMGCG